MDFALAGISFVSIVSALMMVTRRSPVYSAVWLLVCFLSLAGAFVALTAPFLAAIHVVVYTGAILVLFLFVIMLLNLRDDELGDEYPLSTQLGIAAMCTGLFGLLAWPVLSTPELNSVGAVPDDFGTVEHVGNVLFSTYALPFELVSLLIIVAMFGAMVLAKKRMWV